jgi:hypothetical protein
MCPGSKLSSVANVVAAKQQAATGGWRKILDGSVHDLTVFKLHFGKLTLKMYDKGQHYELWQQARGAGADLLWRAKKSSRFDVLESFEDGSYRSYLFSHPELRRRGKAGQEVRVVDYQLKGVQSAEAFYRVVTTVLDPRQAPPRNWRVSTANAGSWRMLWTSSKPICAVRA